MSRKRSEDEVVAVLRNTSNKRKIWDRNEPGIDRVMFTPEGAVGVTALQMENLGKLPDGVVVERYDPKFKHGKKSKIGTGGE